MVAYVVGSWLNRGIVENSKLQTNEPLPPETRLEPPELSYEQELLNTPVPFSNRVEFLSEYEKINSKPMTAKAISNFLGVSELKVQTMAVRLGAGFHFDENESKLYDEMTLAVMDDEIVQQNKYDLLQDQISASAIGKFLSKSEVWVKKTAYGLGVYPEVKNIGKNRVGYVYPKTLIQMLRTLILHFPPANNLHSIDEAETILGKDRKWIEGMVQRHNLAYEMRTHAISQKLGVHYSQATIDELILKLAEIPPLAGDWMTKGRMAELVSRDRKWVNNNLGEYQTLGELRRADSGKSEIHYPLKALVHLQDTIANLPARAGDWMTGWDIAQSLGQSQQWVNDKLKSYEEYSKILLTNTGNRPLVHYSPIVIDALKSLISDKPAHADGWVNAKEVSQMLVKSRDWVSRRIGNVGICSEARLDRRGQPGVHYPPEIIDILQLNYLIDEENSLKV